MTKVILNMGKLLSIERNLPKNAKRVVQKLAQDCEAYAKNNMSAQSPAPAGSFPGVDIGNLINTIVAEPVNDLTWVVNVGADYGDDLEYGTSRMAARPFLLPSVEAIAANAPDKLIKVIEE